MSRLLRVLGVLVVAVAFIVGVLFAPFPLGDDYVFKCISTIGSVSACESNARWSWAFTFGIPLGATLAGGVVCSVLFAFARISDRLDKMEKGGS